MNQLSENRQSSLDLANHLGGVQNKTHPSELQVLIVEDSESDAQLLLRLLKKAGYGVVWQRVETDEQMRAALGERYETVVQAIEGFDFAAALAALEQLP